MTVIYLYTKSECELCDHALAIYEQVCEADSEIEQNYRIEKVDITADEELMERYRLSIPVLERSDTCAELFWPFPPSRLRTFLE